METDQISLVVIHCLIAYASTKIKDNSIQDSKDKKEKDHHEHHEDCRSAYILVVNSLSLIIFSQYLKEMYILIAFIASFYAQTQFKFDKKTNLVHCSILTAVFLLSGGLEMIKQYTFNDEGFGEYIGDYSNYNNGALFTRNVIKPARLRKPNLYNLGQSWMSQSNANLRPQDA